MTPFEIAFTGAVATAATDLWQQTLRRTLGLPAANWRMIGRWVGWMPRGVFIHRSIATASPVSGELAIGWTFHYVIGIAYAALYAVILQLGAWDRPTLASALGFGVVTLAAPWLVMQPAMGAGVMARNLPNRRVARLVTATSHLVFGFGLYIGLRVLGV
ncbi:DUF2938 family protein [Marinobacter caseinilyticus]|uniref:DUF2938 family protein n=1 Tax=Marinobacter caseinilyticus TaxID=2692195 RepID=UPI001409A1B0|nr:DUF2938 family protein [Marinobacter caseinilyticus]